MTKAADSSSDSDLQAWRLAETGQYDKALELYETTHSSWTDDDWRDAGARATTLLCARRYREAAEAFAQVNAMYARAEPLHHIPFLDELGASLWLSGDRQGGAAKWRQSVQGVLNKTITYGDAAGGVTQGLLLWYAGISLPNRDYKAEAESYLRKLSKRSRITSWPGPLAWVVLGKKIPEEVLMDRFGDGRLDVLLERAKGDLLLRRELSQALVCWAASERANGREDDCMRLMARCAEMQNPLLEAEWYLARGEIENNLVS